MRSLWINGKREGTVIFPQRGQGQWSDWGFSNAVMLHLNKRSYQVRLEFQPVNVNMNGKMNEAALDYMRVVKIK